MTGGGGAEKTVIVYEDGLEGDRRLSSVVEATLRHAAEAYRVTVAASEGDLNEALASCQPVLLIADADRLDAQRFERLAAAMRAGPSTRLVPVLAMVAPSNLPALGEGLRLSLVDFILKPFDPDELWGRVRVTLHQASVVGELERERDELARRSMTDSLTGLFNTAFIVDRCDQEVGRAKRYDQPVACLLIDIDNFKTVNDNFGHPVGNEVLRGLAQMLREGIRGSDMLGRYGGEEFLVVLPQTDRAGAVALAERLRQTVESHVFKVGLAAVKVTVSIGVAAFPSPDVIGRETLFLAVDRAVYRAKALGRNRVACLEGGPERHAKGARAVGSDKGVPRRDLVCGKGAEGRGFGDVPR